MLSTASSMFQDKILQIHLISNLGQKSSQFPGITDRKSLTAATLQFSYISYDTLKSFTLSLVLVY